MVCESEREGRVKEGLYECVSLVCSRGHIKPSALKPIFSRLLEDGKIHFKFQAGWCSSGGWGHLKILVG